MIHSLFASALLFTQGVSPSTNAGCLNAPFRLITDNVPVGNGTATSVINIWGFIDNDGGMPAAWLYKNDLGDYYAQFNYRVARGRFDGIPLHAEFFAKPKMGDYLNIVKLSSLQIVALENALIAKGYVRIGCFSKDASM